MDPSLWRDILTGAVGLLSGALSGAFGVGGAVVSTPGIRALGVPALAAVGTTLPSILPSAVSAAVRYRAEDLVDWRTARLVLPGGLVASVAGALLSQSVPGDGHVLMLATAALLAGAAWRMGNVREERSAEATSSAGRTGSPAGPVLVAIGSVAGLLSGLLGIGGGIVLVPALLRAGLPIKAAIATSLVCVGGLAVPGTVAHAAIGNIDWRVAALLTMAVVPGARLGAAATVRADDRRVQRAVAMLLGIISAVYAAGEATALAGG